LKPLSKIKRNKIQGKYEFEKGKRPSDLIYILLNPLSKIKKNKIHGKYELENQKKNFVVRLHVNRL
jgi:hypothetical protein